MSGPIVGVLQFLGQVEEQVVSATSCDQLNAHGEPVIACPRWC